MQLLWLLRTYAIGSEHTIEQKNDDDESNDNQRGQLMGETMNNDEMPNDSKKKDQYIQN